MSERRERSPALLAAIFGLVAMVSWTLAVKVLAPWCWAWAERAAGRVAAAPVMWDFWPIAHAALAWALWRRVGRAWEIALAVALAEIAVVSVKFALFLRAPEWSFWNLLWFTNKLYVLAFFAALAVWLAGRGRRELRPRAEV